MAAPRSSCALAWRPEALELRRLAIKDARSDAVLSATLAGERIQASFSGTLHGHSIPAMLRQPPSADSGTAQGELRVTIDRARPQDTVAEGQLRVEALDLSWLAGRKALIERADITSDSSGVRVSGARFSVEDQVFELSGQGRHTERGPVIEARLESPGVVLDRLLPPRDPGAPPPDESKLWPLPLSGRIEVRSAFVQGPRHRVEPFEGNPVARAAARAAPGDAGARVRRVVPARVRGAAGRLHRRGASRHARPAARSRDALPDRRHRSRSPAMPSCAPR